MTRAGGFMRSFGEDWDGSIRGKVFLSAWQGFLGRRWRLRFARWVLFWRISIYESSEASHRLLIPVIGKSLLMSIWLLLRMKKSTNGRSVVWHEKKQLRSSHTCFNLKSTFLYCLTIFAIHRSVDRRVERELAVFVWTIVSPNTNWVVTGSFLLKFHTSNRWSLYEPQESLGSMSNIRAAISRGWNL